ncbi:hypothetical protein [Enterobacter mori]|uniref:hypothetical protein n=1 Tax=Enterobacter mori TaxID=539813 RepID=UPI003B83C09A
MLNALIFGLKVQECSHQNHKKLVNAYFRQPEKVTFHHIELPTLNELAAMSLEEAQHTVAQAEQRSKVFHGSQGSTGLHMRKSELKTLRPGMPLVDAMGQIGIHGNDWGKADE